MLSSSFIKNFIVSVIVLIFVAGCRTPVITSPSTKVTIDAGDSISFSAEFYPRAIYKWTFDGGAPDRHEQNPTVQFSRAGVYDVFLTVLFSDKESGFACRRVTVNGLSNVAAIVKNTGQTTSYRTGDDGDEQLGISWPNPRFKDNSDGTVTDNLTGLVWLKQGFYLPNGKATWDEAVDLCKTLASGMSGLSDGSSAGNWRLPNINELHSLIHFGYLSPSLPNTLGTGKWSSGDPFCWPGVGPF